MIGLDTNLVVRMLIADDSGQLNRVRSHLERAEEGQEAAFLSDLVLAELEWVLESGYGVPRQRIVLALDRLVRDRRFAFEDHNRVAEALTLYRQGHGDLSDYLVGLRGKDYGVRTTYTFDRALRNDPQFTLL